MTKKNLDEADKVAVEETAPIEAENVEIEASAPQAQTSPPIKRGRGRPPKNPTLNGSGASIPDNAQAAARRGRPPSKLKGLSVEAQANLAKQIQGLHFLAATATGLPELVLSEPEAVMLADAVAAVSREYGLSIDGKTGAALQLIAAAAIVYAPRFKAINMRAKTPRDTAGNQNATPPPSIN